eukprot:9471189-Pyramimonas_sp.AAC.1
MFHELNSCICVTTIVSSSGEAVFISAPAPPAPSAIPVSDPRQRSPSHIPVGDPRRRSPSANSERRRRPDLG